MSKSERQTPLRPRHPSGAASLTKKSTSGKKKSKSSASGGVKRGRNKNDIGSGLFGDVAQVSWNERFASIINEMVEAFQKLERAFRELEKPLTPEQFPKFGSKLGGVDRINMGRPGSQTIGDSSAGLNSLSTSSCKGRNSVAEVEDLLYLIKFELLGELEQCLERGISRTKASKVKNGAEYLEQEEEIGKFEIQYELVETICRSLSVTTRPEALRTCQIALEAKPYL